MPQWAHLWMHWIKSRTGVIILQCQSDFNGYYYDRNDKPILYRGKRPYYVFFIGDVKFARYQYENGS